MVKDGVFVYKLFDKRDAFPFFMVRMPYNHSNTPKSIFYSALVGQFLRIAHGSLLYKDLNEKAMELLTRMKAGSLRCRKALSYKNLLGVEKHYPKSFEDMKKRFPFLDKIVMKFFLNFIFKLES